MNAPTLPPFATPQTLRLQAFFPNADAHVLDALATHTQAMTHYLAQVHDLTLAEINETIEAFFKAA